MEYKRIPLKNLKQNPHHFHEALAGSLVARIKAFKKILHEVEPVPMEKTIDDFLHDMHPEREVAVWEWIAEEYQKKTIGKPLPAAKKLRIYAKLLDASMEKYPLRAVQGVPIAHYSVKTTPPTAHNPQ